MAKSHFYLSNKKINCVGFFLARSLSLTEIGISTSHKTMAPCNHMRKNQIPEWLTYMAHIITYTLIFHFHSSAFYRPCSIYSLLETAMTSNYTIKKILPYIIRDIYHLGFVELNERTTNRIPADAAAVIVVVVANGICLQTILIYDIPEYNAEYVMCSFGLSP